MQRSVLAIVLAIIGLATTGCGAAKTREVRIPSSAREDPSLHCEAVVKFDCAPNGHSEDRVFIGIATPVKRCDIVIVKSPRRARMVCGAGPMTIERIVGLPGETVSEDNHGFISVDGKRLAEPYVSAAERELDTEHFDKEWRVPAGDYFTIGDNRSASCDSRAWGGVPRHNIIGPVVKIIRG